MFCHLETLHQCYTFSCVCMSFLPMASNVLFHLWIHYEVKHCRVIRQNNIKATKRLTSRDVQITKKIHPHKSSKLFLFLQMHCCIKCPQNLQVKTLLQMYTAFTCRIYNEILLKVFDPRNRGNLLLKLQFFVL